MQKFKVGITLQLDKEVADKVKAVAEAEHRSVSNLIQHILIEATKE